MWKKSSALAASRWASLGLALLLTASLSGCKQEEGDRCQLDSDCSDGLICCFTVNPPPLEQRYLGGTCTTPIQCSPGQPDLGELTDGGTLLDAEGDTPQSDSTPAPEASVDGPSADSATVDTGSPDTATVDTGSPDSTVDSQ